MTADKAMRKLRNHLWLAVMTPQGPQLQDHDKAFLMERDPEFPMDYVILMCSLQGKEAFELGKELIRRDDSDEPVEDADGEADAARIILP